MADVVFVYPKTGFDLKHVSIEFPLSAIHASSMLDKEGYKIKIIDQRNDPQVEGDIEKRAEEKSPLCRDIFDDSTQIHYGLEAAKVVRENSDKRIVWGGGFMHRYCLWRLCRMNL